MTTTLSSQFPDLDHLVMGPSTPGTSVNVRILIDCQPPGDARGIDVDEQGFGVVTEQRMYTLVRQSAPIADRQFGIEFSRPWRGGLRLHVRLIGSDIQTNGELP
jgi:hypothetical protein